MLLVLPGPAHRCAVNAPHGLCALASASAALEEPGVEHLVLLVELPEAPGRRGLFVYRREAARLVPRFLGSGFSGFTLTGVAPGGEGTLLVEVVATDGAPSTLRCRFVEFPLVCEELP